jgi:hypothetical protein
MGNITSTATISLRVNFAVLHLLGAARFSRAVLAVEAANTGQPFGEWWEELRDNAVACLFLASACLEAYANELFSDGDKIFPGRPTLLIDTIWEISERKAPVDKLELVLHLRGKPAFDKRARSYKELGAVTRLRNELNHFKPEWTHLPNKHKKISDVLAGYFTPSAAMNDPLIFPRAWATHSCTSWAVNATLTFIEEFEQLAGLTGRTDRSVWASRLKP